MFSYSTRFLALFSLLLACCLTTGCNFGVQGNGVSKTDIRTLSSFEKIKGTGIGDIRIQFGDQPEVKVTTDENLQEFVSTEVVDGTLVLRTTESIRTGVGLKFDVVAPHLTEASISGVGDLQIDQFKGDRLKLKVSGVGSISGTGEVEDLHVSVSGVGDASLKELKAKKVNVSVSGTGGATIFASDAVDASVSGVGSISVYGNPTDRDESTSGIGSVKFKND